MSSTARVSYIHNLLNIVNALDGYGCMVVLSNRIGNVITLLCSLPTRKVSNLPRSMVVGSIRSFGYPPKYGSWKQEQIDTASEVRQLEAFHSL